MAKYLWNLMLAYFYFACGVEHCSVPACLCTISVLIDIYMQHDIMTFA